MILENKIYVPTLAVRPSEMNGLEYLPGATKDRMTPCFLLAPWANSSSLQRTITRIERAFHNRPYFLDIDPDYSITNLDSDAQRELAALKNPANHFENWIAFVREHEWIMPCIQGRGQTEADIAAQIQVVQSMGRPYCMRIVKDHYPENLDEIVGAFAVGGSADFAIILEGGWTRDPLTLGAWFSGVIAESFHPIDASVPVVISCTSMPKMFEAYSQNAPAVVPFNNRRLVEQIKRSSNRAQVVYGDWGSTRPRDQRGIANRPLDRVDYPTEQSWHIARNKEDGWDFRNAATAIVNSAAWNGNLGIWGEEMIKNTTINKELGIDTPPKNVAARVNIHLHRQAFYGEPIDPIAFDEDWED
jgi:hypothetical protein